MSTYFAASMRSLLAALNAAQKGPPGIALEYQVKDDDIELVVHEGGGKDETWVFGDDDPANMPNEPASTCATRSCS